MNSHFIDHVTNTLSELKSDGLFKQERTIISPQAGLVHVGNESSDYKPVINLCANNYLGLADNSELVEVAKEALEERGLGMASVRFICGTQDYHKKLEQELADFLGKEDAILFAACFDANGGLFEPLLTADDAIISDSLNHASIIDGIRLCKAKRYRYANSDMNELEQRLKDAKAQGARFIMIATDGVFSMDGTLAKLPEITSLAKKYDAMVMVDDCHATGFVGPNGKGTHEHFQVEDDVHILTGTLGKALGGSMGGYIAGPQPVIELLRQKARPYLFSNSLAPCLVAASRKAIELVKSGDHLRASLFANTRKWREGLTQLGYDLVPGEHPIVPVMLKEAILAQELASELYKEGVYVAGFFFPVVPRDQARIRTQMNASLRDEDIHRALEAFAVAGKRVGAIS